MKRTRKPISERIRRQIKETEMRKSLNPVIFKKEVQPTIKLKEPTMQRTIFPMKSSIRKELESYVLGSNKYLKDVVHGMSNVMLLRNAHPSYRFSFAAQLQEVGLLHPVEFDEFKAGPTRRY